MGTIEIISDSGYVYEAGHTISVKAFITNFCDCADDESLKDCLWRIPAHDAVAYIAKAWGIEYKFV